MAHLLYSLLQLMYSLGLVM